MAEPGKFDVYQVELVLGYSTDARPCIIIDVAADGSVWVGPLSSAMDLYRGPPQDFLLPEECPGFAETGLTKTCYVIGDKFRQVPRDRLIRRRGRLTGDLAAGFQKWV